jgi:uncharacterized protein (DUF302 family)
MQIGMKRELKVGFEEAIAKVGEALKKEGFGILTEIDMQKTLAQKLGVNIPRYRILGACHPTLAHRALSADPGAGVMLPCNVVVQETVLGKVVIYAADPMQTAAAQAGPELAEVARAVREKLMRAIEELR